MEKINGYKDKGRNFTYYILMAFSFKGVIGS